MAIRERSAFSSGAAQFLDPVVLSRINNLELLARTVVDGFLHGLHRSPHLGLSLDFAEHRAYMPGDDIRRVDWRLFARTDRFYVKQFEAETSANFMVVLDVSKSMSFGTHSANKLDYARYLAASLAYFSQKQRDRVGIVTFDHTIVEYVPPSTRHLELILHTLARVKPGRPGSLRDPLRRLGETLNHRGIILLLSDFYEEPQEVIDSVRHLRSRGHDVIVFHVLDPEELGFTYRTPASFQDLESDTMIPIVPDELADDYRALIQNHTSELSRLFTGSQIDYTLLDTSKPLDYALFHYLSLREKVTRVR
ncbi:MAG: DUF58 domain-containing protein [Gemmatimonadota bacterium]|jgi:uncharacterized protein (DUF58 family)|nr:DUF58 domain-containing protein [Gemmatimonadota bacterium]